MAIRNKLGRGGDTDPSASRAKGIGKGKKKSAPKPKASAWDRLRSRSSSETAANRDVHGSQQLDRGEIDSIKSEALPVWGSAILGVLIAVLIWVLWGLGGAVWATMATNFGGQPSSTSQELKYAQEYGVSPYYEKTQVKWGNSPLKRDCFYPVDQAGSRTADKCVEDLGDLSRPQWHVDATHAAMTEHGVAIPEATTHDTSLGSWLGFGHISLLRLAVTLLGGLLGWGILRTVFLRKLDSVNLMNDTSDINQYEDDQHIALPNEVIRQHGLFPDVGAHSSSAPASLLGHAMLSNNGVNKVKLARRAEADIVDENGDLLVRKGEILTDDDGNTLFDEVPMFDEKFAHKLFTTSGLPKEKSLRKFFNPKAIEYNPGGANRDKDGDQDTIADRINEDWVFPEYEPQRPAGVYFVDEAPVNTMVLAMTRAGKGQTYIEPMIDMWLRERKPNNMVINDPKGELLVKNYVRAATRGYQVVQFNLINALKTDIYNPLAMAAESAREGDMTKCAMYVENIAEVFFPVDGADDPVWPNAANNAFKRTAYGMIDFYLEEERQMRKRAVAEGWDPKVVETRLDEMWGKVTLYNCYQFFVQLSAKKLKDPVTRLKAEMEAGLHGDVENDPAAQQAVEELHEEAKDQMVLWNGEQELDMLTLFFNATDLLPKNTMRDLVGNADKALRAMGAAEKMLASVYGIAITAMSFFTDPTISTLTSGTLSQNTDLGGMSFPRRFGVRFNQNYVRKYNLVGMQVKWESYYDAGFEKPMGKKFEHEDTVSREGWARYYFEGIYEQDVAYLKLRLINTESGTLLKTMYFRFTKSYQTNLKGRAYIKDPIRGNKIVKNGLLVELVREESTGRMVPGDTMFTEKQLNLSELTLEQINNGDNDLIRQIDGETKAILSNSVRYSEQPKAVFLVTPPHLMKYAKLILILVKQLVDLNFDKSYMTKSNQKPLYKTRFMLDELGNLQSEGHGISGFETMLSIGLGQEQQFTLILQTLQQLKDVYGDSVDKIVQGNAANLVFLKSTDDSMIDTLQKMSGTTHRVYRDTKTVTRDVEKVALKTEGKVSYTMTAKEEPVISYNDLAYLPARNSIVFSAGAPPIWNRNETILPMSFALFGNTIIQPGREYSLQTIPTLSSAKEFDVRLNQPNFVAMLNKRMTQAVHSGPADDVYRKAYDYDDFQVSRLDPDVYASEVMDIVDAVVGRHLYSKTKESREYAEELASRDDMEGLVAPTLPDEAQQYMNYDDESEAFAQQGQSLVEDASDNADLANQVQVSEARAAERARKRYAENTVSQEMLVTGDGTPLKDALDGVLAGAFEACANDFVDDGLFDVRAGALVHAASGRGLIVPRDGSEVDQFNELARDPGTRAHAEEEMDSQDLDALGRYHVDPELKSILASLDTWKDLARGHFDREVARLMRIND